MKASASDAFLNLKLPVLPLLLIPVLLLYPAREPSAVASGKADCIIAFTQQVQGHIHAEDSPAAVEDDFLIHAKLGKPPHQFILGYVH